MSTDQNNWPADVLQFWFEELTPKQWFMGSDELDATIKSRFSKVHLQLRESKAIPEPVTADSTLASIIVLDQFSRNMFRGTEEAFSYDSLALSFTKQAIEKKLDEQLEDPKRMFLYMPFMHSENIDDQDKCVSYMTGKAHDSAVEHREIIKQFGRFPYRNEVLNRPSTAEEIAYLQDGKRFGQ